MKMANKKKKASDDSEAVELKLAEQSVVDKGDTTALAKRIAESWSTYLGNNMQEVGMDAAAMTGWDSMLPVYQQAFMAAAVDLIASGEGVGLGAVKQSDYDLAGFKKSIVGICVEHGLHIDGEVGGGLVIQTGADLAEDVLGAAEFQLPPSRDQLVREQMAELIDVMEEVLREENPSKSRLKKRLSVATEELDRLHELLCNEELK